MDYTTIGKQIRKRRRELDLTQEELSELLGLSPGHLGTLERGWKLPSLETFIRICNVLGVSSDRLLSGVLSAESQVKVSDLSEAIKDLPQLEQTRILHVVQMMVEDSQKFSK